MPQKAPCPLYLGYAADFKSLAFITAQSHFSAHCLQISNLSAAIVGNTQYRQIGEDVIVPGEYEELATYSIRGRQEVVCIIYDIPAPTRAARGSHYCINPSLDGWPGSDGWRGRVMLTLCSLAGQESRDADG